MYRDFYHLEYVPFVETPDSDLANLSRRHQVTLERIVKGLNKQQSLIAFMGEAGLGKIALLCSALATYSDTKFKTILIDVHKIHFQNQIYFKDIIKAVYQEIGYEIKYQISPDALIDLHDIFIEEREKGSNLVIVIDHIHFLPLEVLKSLPQLIDAFPGEQPVAQLVLAGAPTLEKRLRDPKLQKLKKRIQLVAKLDTLTRKESIAYIQRKLSAASPVGNPKVFSNAATRKIVKAAKGIPRNLNMICTDALVAGCRRRKKPIPASIVKQVLADFQVRRSRRTSRLVGLGVAVVLLLFLAVGVGFRDSFSGHLQIAAQWPQQALEQVQPLLSDLAQKARISSRQAPEPVVLPMPSDEPVAMPADPPSPDVVVRPPLPLISPTPSAPQAIVKTPKAPGTPLQQANSRTMPPQAPETSLQQPHHRAIRQVANLIDQHFPSGGAFGLKVWSDKAPGAAYVEGEKLVLYVISEAQAFLRIDYYQADGKIVHLLPNPLMSNQVQAGQRFTLGDDGNAFQFKVAPPFGAEMLTVVASQQSMDINAKTATGELNDAYINHLSDQLQTYGAQGKTAAAYIHIQTQPQALVPPKSTEQ